MSARLREIDTYQDLLDYLTTCTPEQRQQKIHACLSEPDGDRPAALLAPCYIGTVREAFHSEDNPENCGQFTRSHLDNDHHPEQIIIGLDYNLFALDGSIADDLLTGERISPSEGKTRNWTGGKRCNCDPVEILNRESSPRCPVHGR